MATTLTRDPDTILRAQAQKHRKGRHSAANLFSFDDYNKEIREAASEKREARSRADADARWIDKTIHWWLDAAQDAGLSGIIIEIDPEQFYEGFWLPTQALWELEQWCQNTGRGKVIHIDHRDGDITSKYRLVLFPNKMQAKHVRPLPKRESALLA